MDSHWKGEVSGVGGQIVEAGGPRHGRPDAPCRFDPSLKLNLNSKKSSERTTVKILDSSLMRASMGLTRSTQGQYLYCALNRSYYG